MKKLLITLTAACLSVSAFAAEEGLVLPNDAMPSYTSDRLTMSMQSGMQVYMNNCMGCHALAFQRYNRAAKDLDMSEDIVAKNLMFTTDKIGNLMTNNMQKESAENWFGTAPPDLSLIARAKGTNWLYNYLRSFYKDDSRPYGVNNSVFKDVGMPHALEEMQGLQDKTETVKGLENDIAYAMGDMATAKAKLKAGESGEQLTTAIETAEHTIHDAQAKLIELSTSGKYFTLVKDGYLSPEEFDHAIVDLVNFLEYVGEPSKRGRESMGVWVLLFILGFGFVAYLLKKEYWKDVH
jgi:ubiquinol-cytochrome c reductase cytochrome c1 subunit